jgi:hypothetical protein
VHSRLEDVLRDKERELKLHHRFIELKNFCEEQIFPQVDLPLKEHITSLKSLIERIIPDPRDRTEEMFSGEIFALLGTIYLHDIGLVKNFTLSNDGEILKNLDISNKHIFMNYGIGKSLNIPEMAIEVINYLSFSNLVKKIPLGWEISEDNKRAIIRNTKVIGHIFNFSHLLHDIFCSDLGTMRLRRFRSPAFVLRSGDAVLEIDNREGVIRIQYKAKFPYELHVLEGAKRYVEDMFALFKQNVNGRLGFQYREIVWDVASDFNNGRDIFQLPKFSPYEEFQNPPFNRWEEASKILDKLLEAGYALVVGEATTGKTTVLKSFVMPQLLTMAPNVFYCELWEHPVDEIRDVVCRRHKLLSYKDLDIVVLCRELLKEGPCFFVLDGCERLTNTDEKEREKFQRFIDFCLAEQGLYPIVAGDRDTFFEWYFPFTMMCLTAVTEIRPIEGTKAIDKADVGSNFSDDGRFYKPIEFELLMANLNLDNVLQDLLKDVRGDEGFRGIVAVLGDRNDKHLNRYTVDDLFRETYLPREKIHAFLEVLKEKDIVTESESRGATYYSLSSKYLKEPLHRSLSLNDFDDRRKLRNTLQNYLVNETFLDEETLDVADRWRESVVFSKEEMGLILASLIFHSREYSPFFEKAKKDNQGVDIQQILRLIYLDDPERRRAAVRLLISIDDKNMVNPLLMHLRHEDVREIRDLLIRGIGVTGKKRAIFAILNTLREIGDNDLQLRAIEFFYSLLGRDAVGLLEEVREREGNSSLAANINRLLSSSLPAEDRGSALS